MVKTLDQSMDIRSKTGSKNNFEKTLSSRIKQSSEKLWKKLESIEILSL